MATIINNPAGAPERTSESHVSMVFVLLVLLIAGVLFYMYGLPGRQVNDGMNINVPDSVDVNVRTPDVTPSTGGAGATAQ
jgi:hypothetical protein